MKRFARWLRELADRIDSNGAPKLMSYSFTFELREGIRFRSDGKGCPLAYLGDASYERAHDEADRPPPRIDWRALDDSRRERRRAAADAWRRVLAGKDPSRDDSL